MELFFCFKVRNKVSPQINKNMIYCCEKCNLIFKNFQSKANHVRWKHQINDLSNFSKGSIKANETKYGKWIEKNAKCDNLSCKNELTIQYREKIGPKNKYFCSKSCANSRGPRNKEFKEKVSKKIKEQWVAGKYDLLDLSKNKKWSSKIERKIIEHFVNKFPNDKWKTGGLLSFKENKISRDLWSDKIKVCFEYDGIWHFKDIHGQLEHKRKIDSLLEEWCITNKYRLIRLQEGHFHDESKIFCELEKVIYFNTESIVKIGNLYSF